MIDRQSTPSPESGSESGSETECEIECEIGAESATETELAGEATAQATQVIRTQDPTLTIKAPTQATDPTLAIPQPTRVAEPAPTTREPTRATAQAAARARVEAEKARKAAEQAQAVADRSRWKAEDTAAQPWYMRKRVALPSAVVAAFAFLMITTGGNDSGLFRAVSSTAKPTAQAVPSAPPPSAVMGQSVRDGKFAFMVTGMPKPAKSFTDRFGVKQSAQGTFVVVRIKVSNIGYDARSLNPTDLFLIDNQGRRFATSSAILTFGGAETIFLNKINPGQSVSNAPVVFDIAPGTVVASIELHDSMTSRGVQVKLP